MEGAPRYDLRDSETLALILSWKQHVSKTHLGSLEEEFVSKLDSELQTLGRGNASTIELYNKLSSATKLWIAHHPYMAGYFRGQFQLTPSQLIWFVANRLLARNAEQRRDSLDGETQYVSVAECRLDARELSPICSLIEQDFIPLFEDGDLFTCDLESEARKHSLQTLKSALRDIEETNERTRLFIDNYLWHLALRRNTKETKAFSSRSFQCLPGLALFCNAGTARVKSLHLEEALVHETIHSFLFFAEGNGSPLLVRPEFSNRTAISSWSGSTLDLHTAGHAYVVWLSLLFYWDAVSSSQRVPMQRRDFAFKRVHTIEAGFSNNGFEAFDEAVRSGSSSYFCVLLDALMSEWFHKRRT